MALVEVVVLKATYKDETDTRAFIANSASEREDFIMKVLNLYRNNPSSVLYMYDERKDAVKVEDNLRNESDRRIVITASLPGFEFPFRLEISAIVGWDASSAEKNPDLSILYPLKLTVDKLL